MAVMGLRLAQRANGVSQLHGHVSREHVQRAVAGVRRGRGADRLDHQRRARADLGGPRGHRAGDQPGRRPGVRRHRGVLGRASTRSPAPTSGRPSGTLRERLVDDARKRLRPLAGEKRGAAKAELGWIDDRARPRRADDRLRAPRAVVQAAHADAARPGAAQAAAARPGAAGPARHRRQGAPRRRRRQEADPGDRAARRRPRGPAPDRLPARLRHRDGAAALPGLRRVAQQPAAPATRRAAPPA